MPEKPKKSSKLEREIHKVFHTMGIDSPEKREAVLSRHKNKDAQSCPSIVYTRKWSNVTTPKK